MTTKPKPTIKLSISDRIAQKKTQFAKCLEDVQKVLDDADEDLDAKDYLPKMGLDELQTQIHEGSVDPKELLHLFQAKCLSICSSGSTAICGFIPTANDQAVELNITQHSKPRTARAPLFGIPVSLDESFQIKGQDNALGFGTLCGQVSPTDAVLYQVLKEEGAIPFVQTACPQGFLFPNSYNPIVGDLSNPSSENHMAGAASCGEAILLTKYGSPIGFGSDLTGGLRLSAAFCGLSALKPSSRRIGSRGMRKFNPDPFVLVPQVPGPIGYRVGHLADTMRTVLRPALFQLDTDVAPLSFHEQLYAGTNKPKLTIGYYETLEDPAILQTVPSVRRAIQRAVEALQEAGHHVQKFQPPAIFHAFELSMHALFSNITAWSKKNLSSGPVSDEVKQVCSMLNPSKLRQLIIQCFGKSSLKSRRALKMKRPMDVFHLIEEINSYREEFANALVEACDMDIVIAPVWTSPAPGKDTPPKFNALSLIYSLLYNMLDAPSGIVPAGIVTADDLTKANEEANSRPGNADKGFVELLQLQKDSLSLPISVQVIGKPYHEEVVLRVMKELEEAFRS